MPTHVTTNKEIRVLVSDDAVFETSTPEKVHLEKVFGLNQGFLEKGASITIQSGVVAFKTPDEGKEDQFLYVTNKLFLEGDKIPENLPFSYLDILEVTSESQNYWGRLAEGIPPDKTKLGWLTVFQETQES